MHQISPPYDEAFYQQQAQASFRSAQIYAQHLHQFVKPSSVVDFGCGRGTWLRAFSALGATRLVGYDGPWNSQNTMGDHAISFIPADLNKSISCDHRFDLAISVEVAEHLLPESAANFIRSLTEASDLVLFGAAYPGQGGTNHFNEQPPSYWAEKFRSLDYQPFDVFRPSLWSNSEVNFWYRQNTFIYAKNGTTTFNYLVKNHLLPVESTGFMDCVHPELLELAVKRGKTGYKIRNIIRSLVPKPLIAATARWRSPKSA